MAQAVATSIEIVPAIVGPGKSGLFADTAGNRVTLAVNRGQR